MSQNQELIQALERIQADTKFVMEFLAKNVTDEKVTQNNYEKIAYDLDTVSGIIVTSCYEMSEVLDDMIEQLDN